MSAREACGLRKAFGTAIALDGVNLRFKEGRIPRKTTALNAILGLTPAAMSATRPMYWSVRRELWENRSIYIAPPGVAAVYWLGFLISVIGLPHSMRALPALDPAYQRIALATPYGHAAMLLMLTQLLVGIFYSLDGLHGERRDRSILFWKSLPVSDLTTVLSKASIPLRVSPAARLRDHRYPAILHAVAEHRGPGGERSGGRHAVDPVAVVPDGIGVALRSDRACALACATLRVAAAGLRLGAARDVSLGRVAAPRDGRLREDRVPHFVFRLPAARPIV